MLQPIDFFLQCPGYFVKRLTPEDADVIQRLYEQCENFFILTDGIKPSSTAALEEFYDVPDGKTAADIYILGLFDTGNTLLGIIAALQHYPDDQTWWIGLMMIAPGQRRYGLGAYFYKAFEHWITAQGIALAI